MMNKLATRTCVNTVKLALSGYVERILRESAWSVIISKAREIRLAPFYICFIAIRLNLL